MILRAENLTYTYQQNTPFKNVAVNGISFDIYDGEILGIIGHTGSGKSTVLQMLNGLLKPTYGTVFFKNRDIWSEPKKMASVRSQIGLVFQYPEYQLFEETVFEDIAYGPKNMGLIGDELNSRVYDAAKTVGISEDLLQKSPFDLSGGEKRKAAIAGIMAMRPKIIVFDEPTAGLDPKGRETVYKAILDYRDNFDATIVVVSHSMEDVAEFTDRIVVLNDGTKVAEGSVKEVFANAEMLKSIGLNVPSVTNVMIKLKEKGIDIPTDIYTVDEAAKCILRLLKGGEDDA